MSAESEHGDRPILGGWVMDAIALSTPAIAKTSANTQKFNRPIIHPVNARVENP
jgi:hypothetical protein